MRVHSPVLPVVQSGHEQQECRAAAVCHSVSECIHVPPGAVHNASPEAVVRVPVCGHRYVLQTAGCSACQCQDSLCCAILQGMRASAWSRGLLFDTYLCMVFSCLTFDSFSPFACHKPVVSLTVVSLLIVSAHHRHEQLSDFCKVESLRSESRYFS